MMSSGFWCHAGVFVGAVVFSGGGLGRSGINSNFTLWAIVCPGLEITNSAQKKGSSAMRRWACIMGRIYCFSNSFVWRNVKMAVINVPKAKIAKIMFIEAYSVARKTHLH